MERARAGEEITVDLEARTAGGYPFELDDHARECLLEGLDDIALTLREDEEISAYEAAHPALISTLDALADQQRIDSGVRPRVLLADLLLVRSRT